MLMVWCLVSWSIHDLLIVWAVCIQRIELIYVDVNANIAIMLQLLVCLSRAWSPLLLALHSAGLRVRSLLVIVVLVVIDGLTGSRLIEVLNCINLIILIASAICGWLGLGWKSLHQHTTIHHYLVVMIGIFSIGTQWGEPIGIYFWLAVFRTPAHKSFPLLIITAFN